MQILISIAECLLSEIPGDGLEFISKNQSHCAKMTFANKSIYDRLSKKLRIKEGNQK